MDLHRRGVVVGVILAMIALVGLFWLSERANDRALEAEHDKRVAAEEALQAQQEEAEAEAGEETAVAGADAAAGYLREACRSGDKGACRLREEIDSVLDGLAEVRDDPETQESETQDPELQEPEVQEPEIQEPEAPDAEQQEAETQDPDADDPETQDGEVQDAEVQEAEVDDPDPDDPEQQDPEVQDPEKDDPDPNSALTFAARDNCNPGEGHVVVDVGLSVERGDGTVTFVLTCQTAPAGPPANAGSS